MSHVLKNRPLFTSRFLFLLCCLVPIFLLSCQNGRDPVVVITIPEVPSGIVSIAVTSELDGQAGRTITLATSAGSPQRFGIAVPAGSGQTLRVALLGLGEDGCRAAEGSFVLSLSGIGFPAEVTTSLVALPTHRCTVTVRIHAGIGRVLSLPAGLDCTQAGDLCSMEFDTTTATSMRLLAESDPRTYASWAGDCIGINDCALPMNRASTVEVAFIRRSCSVGSDICSYSPAPIDATYLSVASGGEEEAWAVGQQVSGGATLRYRSRHWSEVPTGVTSTLRSVWAGPAGQAWAVGDNGTVLRFAGSQFQSIPTGLGPTAGALFGVWGSSNSDVWAVGENGVIVHFDGAAFSRFANPASSTTRLTAVWGSAANDVWVVGLNGTVLHWNGASWQSSTSPNSFASFNSVFGAGERDVYALAGRTAWRWNGDSWVVARQESAPLLQGFARAPNDVWLLREGQQTLHYDGAAWTRDQIPTAATGMLAIASASATDIWAAGTNGQVFRGKGGQWTQDSGHTYGVGLSRLSEIYGGAADDIWVSGSYQTLHWNGQVWRTEGPDNVDCSALFGSGRDDVWMLGNRGEVLHYDGTKWTQLNAVAGATFSAGWSVGKMQAYAVSSGAGGVFRWDGTAWARDLAAGSNLDLRGVWAKDSSTIWAVTNGGLALRFDGNSWTQTRVTTLSLLAVSGSSASNVFLVGEELWHWDGTAFARGTKLVPGLMRGVRALSDGTALAVSGYNGITRWDGSQWTALAGAFPPLLNLFAATASDIWFVGDRSTILRYRP